MLNAFARLCYMPQNNVQLIPLDRTNSAHLDLMYAVRTHPEVDKHLCNSPPDSFETHVQYLERAQKSGCKEFFLISFNGTLCGYCHTTSQKDAIELGWALHPDWWGKGIGRSCVKLLVETVQHSVKELTLIVKKDNVRAFSLYQKCGFAFVRETENQEYLMRYLPNPEISVVLCTYRRNYGDEQCPNFFIRAMDSILQQTFKDFELILIDDGSTDGTAEIAKKYAENDVRVRYIRFDPNSNAPAMRYNQGIGFARGKWVAFMFDDDAWLPNALEDLHRSIAPLPPIYGMVNGTVEYNHSVDGVNQIIDSNFGHQSDSFRKMFLTNKLANNSVLIRREVFDLVGGYDESPCMRRICDWDLWIRIQMRYKTKVVPKQVAKVYAGLADSLLNNFKLNHFKVYGRQLLYFRKQPLRKNDCRMSPAQWKHFLCRIALMPFYLSLRCIKLFLFRALLWRTYVFARKSAGKVLKPILKKWGLFGF